MLLRAEDCEGALSAKADVTRAEPVMGTQDHQSGKDSQTLLTVILFFSVPIVSLSRRAIGEEVRDWEESCSEFKWTLGTSRVIQRGLGSTGLG